MEEGINKRILLVSQYFWPENFPIIYDLCKDLDSKGYQITVLTGYPNYPDGELNSKFRANPLNYSSLGNIEIIRVPIFLRGKSNKLKLFINYLSFVISATLLGGWKIRNKVFDFIFVYEPSPITVCLPAIAFKYSRKIPLVLWVQDLWPDNLIAINATQSKFIIRLIKKLVSFIYRSCDLLLAQSQAFCEEIEKYEVDPSKVKYFPNFYSEMDLMPLNNNPLETNSLSQKFKILFAGNIGEAQDMPSILEAAQILKTESIGAIVLIAGNGKKLKWVKNEIEQRNLNNQVRLIGHFPMEFIPALFNSADALLVSLNKSKAFNKTIPGKIPYYLASSKPILGMVNGETARIIRDANCGFVADAGNTQALVHNIKKLMSMSATQPERLGINGLHYAEREFHKKNLISKLELWIKEL
ncbi:glycosyltransferase family 4 protein [Gammaproteobacteria bacterium]|nr:glycosyltransferase family 4 protein [Gammaproteobacteria bacterium]MDA9174453.1 glycosyltransferase family 4 protein [Gammaproteobacteria bacterium]MDA9834619.1 glycosyltransferase family 4 protein [Gammaproteobacteria bacterium]MDC3371965.1 glycosyltransferase family 4 protein [Gammaproteobacteria bacterium]